MAEVDEDEVELEFVPPPPQDVITKIVKIKKRYLIFPLQSSLLYWGAYLVKS